MNDEGKTVNISPPIGLSNTALSDSARAVRAESKSSLMFVSVILFYLGCAITLNPRLFLLFGPVAEVAGNLVVALFIAQLNAFWLFGGYYLMLGIFAAITWLVRTPAPPPILDGPPIAVLYVTMNDFQEQAALSCVRQNYDRCHLFILDDSVDTSSRIAVDSFSKKHPGAVTVVRRSDRRGYKAGSLSWALRNHVRGFEYFILVDSDSVIPEGFASQLLPYFDLEANIGWVQGSHAPNPIQKTPFAKDLALGILPLWKVYYGPRNRFGNVIFLGHGGMVRYDVWQKTGGFPEIVAEDLAFSTEAARLGYRGYFARNVVS